MTIKHLESTMGVYKWIHPNREVNGIETLEQSLTHINYQNQINGKCRELNQRVINCGVKFVEYMKIMNPDLKTDMCLHTQCYLPCTHWLKLTSFQQILTTRKSTLKHLCRNGQFLKANLIFFKFNFCSKVNYGSKVNFDSKVNRKTRNSGKQYFCFISHSHTKHISKNII